MATLGLHAQVSNPKIFGHRGCRGILPENSIEGIQKAIDLGVDGIEFDVVVNKDKQIVISHAPYMEKKYCLIPDRGRIKQEKEFNLFQMTQMEIEQFDCGSKYHPNFPKQKKLKTYKPLLQELFSKVDFSEVMILFEIKSEKRYYGKYQPQPDEYVDIILKEVSNYVHRKNIVFMSFDANIINELHNKAPQYKLVYLTHSSFKSVKSSIKDLTIKPYAIGMHNPTISKREIIKAHELGIAVFAWTVNTYKDFERLKRYGIDGIITDYPGAFIKRESTATL
jgi:glycerophosphoryl diester phosphodiesterase